MPQLKEPTMCGWYQGHLKKFVPTETKPYLIRWSCKPAIEMLVSEKVIRLMVMNYKYCEENDIFKGIVGTELLWVCKLKGFSLRFVKVLAFPTKGSRLYQLAFRDGKTMELTPEHLDRAFVRHERITRFEPVVTNFTDVGASEALFTLAHMNAAEKEKAMYPPTRSVYNQSAMYGSDFSSSSSQDGDGDVSSSSSQDGDGDVPSSFSHEPETTAKTLVALSKVPLNDELVSKSPEEDLGTTAGLEEEDAVMYRAVSKLVEVMFPVCDVTDLQSVKDSVMSLSGKETVEDTTRTAELVGNTVLPKVAIFSHQSDNRLKKKNAETLAAYKEELRKKKIQEDAAKQQHEAAKTLQKKLPAEEAAAAKEELRKKKDQEDASWQQQGAAESLQQQKQQAAAAAAKEELQKTMEKEEAAQQQEAAADTLEQKKAADDKGETDTDSQVIKLCEPCVFSCMSCCSGGVV
jgi:hypothetical protein